MTTETRLSSLVAKVRTAAFGGKRGGVQTIAEGLHRASDLGAQVAVVAFVDDDGVIQCFWSDGNLNEKVGLCAFTQHQMLRSYDERACDHS